MDRLCKARRLSISQIQKYLFPIQVSPVHQVLGTPPMKDCAPEKAQGNYTFVALFETGVTVI